MRILLVLLFIGNCALQSIILEDEIIERPYRTSVNTMFNYEDASKKYTIDNINAHYRLHIEIEKPHIIESVTHDIDDIYIISNIEGTTIIHAQLDKRGRINSHKIVKRAGLGLDEIAERIFKGIKLKPGYIAGYSHKTEVYVRITFVGKKRL
ncbi:MAG: energy transducer TonB [Spirochaetota bacterium]|nr:energy transducer TonB [Spirochaetota bacterium]